MREAGCVREAGVSPLLHFTSRCCPVWRQFPTQRRGAMTMVITSRAALLCSWKVCILTVVISFLLGTTRVSAAHADPEPAIFVDSQGRTTPPLFLLGDEHESYLADTEGFTVLKDKQGVYVYAEKNRNGKLVSSKARVGLKDPKSLGLVKNLKPTKRPNDALATGMPQNKNNLMVKTNDKERRQLWFEPTAPLCGTPSDPCTVKHLVVLVRFADHSERGLPDREEYANLLNGNGQGTVENYFQVNSNDSVNLESFVTDWIPVSKTEEYAVANEIDPETGETIVYNGANRPQTREVWNEALSLLESSVFDFSEFDSNGDGTIDMLTIVHSGAGAEKNGNCRGTQKAPADRIWSHNTRQQFFRSESGIRNYGFSVASGVWSDCPLGGSQWEVAHLGIFVHEIAHQW